jgi:hypothetical protein
VRSLYVGTSTQRRRYASAASSVMVAFSTFDTGQFALALSASSLNLTASRPGTFARGVQHL